MDPIFCNATVDFNVPGKPNPPPVKLAATVWTQSHFMPTGTLKKYALEFTHLVGSTLGSPSVPLNTWVQLVHLTGDTITPPKSSHVGDAVFPFVYGVVRLVHWFIPVSLLFVYISLPFHGGTIAVHSYCHSPNAHSPSVFPCYHHPLTRTNQPYPNSTHTTTRHALLTRAPHTAAFSPQSRAELKSAIDTCPETSPAGLDTLFSAQNMINKPPCDKHPRLRVLQQNDSNDALYFSFVSPALRLPF